MRTLVALAAALPMASVTAACSSSDGMPGASAHAPTAPDPRAADEQTGQAGAVALTADMASPYFMSDEAAAAAEAFRLERWQEARDGFAALLESGDGPADEAARARILLLRGLADAGLEAWDDAADALVRAREGLPLLADFIGYHAARAHFAAGDLERAAELAEAVEPESIVGAEAALLYGDILRTRGDTEAAAAHYAAYLDSDHRLRRTEARYRLAEANESLGEDSEDTLGHYRRVAIRAPLSEWAEPASERITAILAALPDARRKALESLSGPERLARGMAYYGSMRHEKAARDLDAALASGDLDADQRCEAAYYRAHAWFRARDRTKSAPLMDEAIDICGGTDKTELQVRAAYVAGRSYAMLGEPETSIARHALVEANHPEHSFADDARLRQVEQYENLEDSEKVAELLSTIPDLYPDGDMRGEALWRLAWRAFKDERYEPAIAWLQKYIEAEPIAQNYWAEGQAQYWIGRAHGELGDTKASVAAYKDAVRTYPLTYYALLSLNRLRENHEWHFQDLVAEIAKDPEGYDPNEPVFSFEPRPVYGEPGFQRGLELLRLGLGEAAEEELRKLGLVPPPHRSAVDDPDLAEKLWAMAFLYDRAGRYATSHWPTRWHIVDYKRQWPTGAARARWRIAYPKAWWEVIDRHAANHGYPTELQVALVREESRFNPLVESWANAVGLTQLIMPTARRFARGTGITVSRKTLRDPDTNVRIGARFLGFLHDRYDGHPMLMVPAYNAGEGAVDRWLRRRPDLPTDAWVEEIGPDQPRNYAKRLIGSYFAYTYLGDGSIPELPNTLPDQ